MTTEEKAKAYDEALEKIRPLYEQAKKDDNPIWSTYEYLFPQLRESEDERIRKEIIDFLETIPISELKRVPRPICKWFFWLEKQKEHHIPWYDYQKSKEAGYTIVPNEEYEQLIKQKEQKPAWSEEDEKNMVTLFEILNLYQRLYDGGVIISAGHRSEFLKRMTELSNWLKSLRPSWKPSKEQMNMLKTIVDRAFYREDSLTLHNARVLKSLYEQLQKLM